MTDLSPHLFPPCNLQVAFCSLAQEPWGYIGGMWKFTHTVCVHTCTHACHTHNMHMHARTHMYLHTLMYVQAHVHVHVHAHTYSCTSIHALVDYISVIMLTQIRNCLSKLVSTQLERHQMQSDLSLMLRSNIKVTLA